MSILLRAALVVVLVWLLSWILFPAVGLILHPLLVLAVIILMVWLITDADQFSV